MCAIKSGNCMLILSLKGGWRYDSSVTVEGIWLLRTAAEGRKLLLWCWDHSLLPKCSNGSWCSSDNRWVILGVFSWSLQLLLSLEHQAPGCSFCTRSPDVQFPISRSEVSPVRMVSSANFKSLMIPWVTCNNSWKLAKLLELVDLDVFI